MSKLKNLVPPLELCKQIPEGAFSNSALVWTQGIDGMFIDFRDARPEDEEGDLPAPTLQEILEEFDHVVCASRFKRQWLVSYEDDPVDEDASKWGNMIDIRDTDAPTAALKLFLEMEARR